MTLEEMAMKCEHKYVDMEDGTLRKFCVRCSKFASQAQLMQPTGLCTALPSSLPAAREKAEVPFYNGSEHTRIEIYKDDLMKRLHEEIGLLSKNPFNSASR